MAPCPLPGMTWCLAGGPWGQRSLSTWPALPPALPTDTQAGAEEGHQETPAWHEGKGWQWREKQREGSKCHLPRWGRCPAAAPAPCRADPHPGPSVRALPRSMADPTSPQNHEPGGGQTPPHAPKSDSPERGCGGRRAGSSPLAWARGARRGANFPGLMQDASGSAFAFCGFLGAGQKSHNPTSCTFGFN